MQITLGKKKKFWFIDGLVEIHVLIDLNRLQLEKCNHLIHSWLLNFASDQISSTMLFHENTIDVWINLK